MTWIQPGDPFRQPATFSVVKECQEHGRKFQARRPCYELD